MQMSLQPFLPKSGTVATSNPSKRETSLKSLIQRKRQGKDKPCKAGELWPASDMDLTIHYHFSLPGDVIKVRRAIEKLHETACGLVFQSVDPIVELKGKETLIETESDETFWSLKLAAKLSNGWGGRRFIMAMCGQILNLPA